MWPMSPPLKTVPERSYQNSKQKGHLYWSTSDTSYGTKVPSIAVRTVLLHATREKQISITSLTLNVWNTPFHSAQMQNIRFYCACFCITFSCFVILRSWMKEWYQAVVLAWCQPETQFWPNPTPWTRHHLHFWQCQPVFRLLATQEFRTSVQTEEQKASWNNACCLWSPWKWTLPKVAHSLLRTPVIPSTTCLRLKSLQGKILVSCKTRTKIPFQQVSD